MPISLRSSRGALQPSSSSRCSCPTARRLAPVLRGPAAPQVASSSALPGHAHVSPEVFQESLPYAVIDFGGMKQYVEEGVTIALAKKDIAQVSLGDTIQFSKVMALKHGGELFRGSPYLEECVVEGCLEDEFRGPTATQRPADHPEDLVLGRVRITSIRCV